MRNNSLRGKGQPPRADPAAITSQGIDSLTSARQDGPILFRRCSRDRAADLDQVGVDQAGADAFRAFAHAHPATYRLLFAPLPEAWRPTADLNRRATEPILRTAAALAGPVEALEAGRTLTAWAHGFVSMELAGGFRLGGDLERAYAFGVERLADALAAPR